MTAIENALNLIEIDLRRDNPAYASIAAPEPLAAADIQRLLDPDSILLQYTLGEERSFVLAVTRESIRAVELANRATVDAAARRAYENLQGVGGQPQPHLEELGRLVIEPVAQLIGRKRLLVVADGALQYVPFSVLTLAGEAGSEQLIEQREIVSLPSLSVLAMQRARLPASGDRDALVIFADPVFGTSDPRVAGVAGEASAMPAAMHGDPSSLLDSCTRLVCRSASGAVELPRLAGTGLEADALVHLLGDEHVEVNRGFDASRARLFEQNLAGYRVIHFATHGMVDSRYPALSALVLSQVDVEGRAQDGLIRLGDIYRLRLDADLVVLSACDTALGEEVRGEGLLGLTQGFIYAGAKSLVASLWQVPDRVTAELMERFYGHLFREGSRPAAALRKAQLEIAAQRRWRHPFYWGAFTMLGDWQ
jgi:CHAT domain-containing protein